METVTESRVISGGPGYVQWRPEEGLFGIELSRDLIPKMIEEIAKARQLGLETGGLLVGSFPRAESPTIRISGFVPVERREEDGSRFVLNAAQRARLLEAGREANTRETSAVGFFHSCLPGAPLTLSSDDLTLAAEQFQRAIHVALLIQTDSPRNSAFFLSISGKMAHDPLIRDFLFDEDQLKSLVRAEQRFAPAQEEEFGGRGRGPAGNSEQTNTVPAPKGWPKLMMAILLLLGVAGGMALRPLVPGSALDQWAPVWMKPLNLKVWSRNQTLNVSWNHQSQGIYQAKSAALVIADLGHLRRVELSPSDLQQGTLSYEGVGRRAQVTMVLNMPDATTVSQSIALER